MPFVTIVEGAHGLPECTFGVESLPVGAGNDCQQQLAQRLFGVRHRNRPDGGPRTLLIDGQAGARGPVQRFLRRRQGRQDSRR